MKERVSENVVPGGFEPPTLGLSYTDALTGLSHGTDATARLELATPRTATRCSPTELHGALYEWKGEPTPKWVRFVGRTTECNGQDVLLQALPDDRVKSAHSTSLHSIA